MWNRYLNSDFSKGLNYMKKTVLALAMASVVVPAAAQAQDRDYENYARDGFRIEARATYETPTVSSIIESGDVYKLGSAMAWGGEVGYDAAVGGDLTVGPYAQYEFGTVETCVDGICLSSESYFEAGLSLGYAINPDGALYGKLGYGELELEATDGIDTISDSNGGIAFALGYEQGFGSNFYGRIEGGYADVGEFDGVNVQRRHFGGALGLRF